VLSISAFDAYGTKVSGGNTGEPWGYAARVGYYLDEETGLQLLTYRYYDPNQGRFLTRDPIGELGGVNLCNRSGG
jgi:RHS repeat-associated protein